MELPKLFQPLKSLKEIANSIIQSSFFHIQKVQILFRPHFMTSLHTFGIKNCVCVFLIEVVKQLIYPHNPTEITTKIKLNYFQGVPFTGTDYTLLYWPFGDFMCRFVSETFFLPL